jgi:hypothetical protein
MAALRSLRRTLIVKKNDMAPDELQKHILATYLTLRFGMGIITFAFPILVVAAGAWQHYDLQASLSAYYWAGENGWFHARTVFVGGLFAIGALFYLYKGFTVLENIAFNAAAIFAALVALVPTGRPAEHDVAAVQAVTDGVKFSAHGASAVALFLCLAYVVLFRALDTLPLLPPGPDGTNEARVKKYKRTYRIVGIVMLASPLTAYVLNSFIGLGGSFVLFIEAAGVWAFGAFWWVKNRELKESSAVRNALEGHVEVAPVGRGIVTAHARLTGSRD